MNISNFLVAALLLTAVGASAQNTGGSNQQPGHPGGSQNVTETTIQATPKAPASSGIKLSGVTGEVKIKTAGGTMTVKAGEPIPEIPAGAEIIVVSGDANVAVGGNTIKAGAGDSFTINTSGTGGATITVTGGIVDVVDASGKSSALANGEGTTLSMAPAPAKTPAPTTTTTQTKTKTPAESIPADSGTTYTPPASSPTQERAATTCTSTVSPSAPCP